MTPYTHTEAVGLIWSTADLLRGTYKAHDYGDVILPLAVLRRLDQALVDTRQAVLDPDAPDRNACRSARQAPAPRAA